MDELNNLSGRVLESVNDVRNLTVEVGKLRSAVNLQKDLQGKEEEFLKGFEENAGKIGNIKEDFEKSLYDFRLLSSDLQKKLLDKFDEEIKKEVHGYFEGLKGELGEYRDLKEKVNTMAQDLDKASSELEKFNKIAAQIQTGDFELSKHAKKLEDMDAEKLELMRKIDTLERLLAKMRRG